MISNNCKYAYYSFSYVGGRIETKNNIKELLNERYILSIVGYNNYLTINTKTIKTDETAYMALKGFYTTLFCKYTPDSTEYLWILNNETRSIIESYLGIECKNIEEVREMFMTKVLSGK